MTDCHLSPCTFCFDAMTVQMNCAFCRSRNMIDAEEGETKKLIDRYTLQAHNSPDMLYNNPWISTIHGFAVCSPVTTDPVIKNEPLPMTSHIEIVLR